MRQPTRLGVLRSFSFRPSYSLTAPPSLAIETGRETGELPHRFTSTYSVLRGVSVVEVVNRTIITRVTTTRDSGLHTSVGPSERTRWTSPVLSHKWARQRSTAGHRSFRPLCGSSVTSPVAMVW